MPPRHISRILFLLMPLVCSFHQEIYPIQRSNSLLKSSYLDNNVNNDNSMNNARNSGPTFPSSFSPQQPPTPQNPPKQQNETSSSREEGQANTRFSVFAPDPSLDASDFRAQLRENMKADLERRRNEDPNRGNQIAKNYLDSL